MSGRIDINLFKAKHKQKKQKMRENLIKLLRMKKLKKEQKQYESSVSSDDEGNEFFIWEKYLERQHAKPVPKTAFKHVSDAKTSGFKSGMKIEAKDQTSSTDCYWVATVVMVSGPLLLLRFDGYDEDRSGDFWLDSSSELLQPIGWCARTNNILIPPEAIRHKKSNWAKFLVENLRDAVAAPDDLFHIDASDDNDTEGNIRVGECVEVQDDSDPLCYWQAVIVEKYGLRLRLRFSGYEEESYDIWEYYFSHRIHNLGWGKSMGLTLQPPNVFDRFPAWKTFKEYGKLCQSQTTRQQLNQLEKIPKATGIKVGMKLEAVNPQDPSAICIASIKQILNDYFFTVEIDSVHQNDSGSTPQFICHAKSKYLYPVGWSERNNILLKPNGFTSFKWADYLEQTQSEPAPDSLFNKDQEKFRAKADFNTGDVVEILDKEDPSCYWIATVTGYGIKYHLRYYGTSLDINEYRFADTVHPLGWGKTMGLRFKPHKFLKVWEDERRLLESIFEAEDASTCVMDKLDKKDNLPPVHGFKPGMQLEAVNPQDPSSICVASVIECNSQRYFTVQIDDFIELNQDKKLKFWCHAKSKNIFPVGWCKKNNVQLTPPPGNPYKEFLWQEYMKSKKTTAAPESLFCQVTPCSNFEVGLKLEAVDQTSPQTISVATVTQVVAGTIWLRLDGYQSNAVEQIYDVESYNMLPVGWSSMHGHPLISPIVKKNEAEPRKWATSLRKRATPSSTPADSSTNKRRKTDTKPTNNNTQKPDKHSKTKEFSISVVVKSNNKSSTTTPVTSGIATPSSSTGDDSARQEVCSNEMDTDTASEDDNPKPTTTIDLTDDSGRIGDKELLLFIKKTCSCGPYLHKSRLAVLPDRIGPAPPNTVLKQVVEQVVLCATSRPKVLEILSSEKEKQSFLSILKTLTTKLEICENLFSLNKVDTCSRCDKDIITANKTNSPTKLNSPSKLNSPIKPTPPTLAKPSSTTNSLTNTNKKPPLKLNSVTSPPSTSKTIQSPTKKNGAVLNGDTDEVLGKIPTGHISAWSIDEVIQFVSPRGCTKFATVFQEQEVDGKALMLLSLDDIHKVLGVTLGPAIKLHDDVQKLRYKEH